jgi:hypothetical protein
VIVDHHRPCIALGERRLFVRCSLDRGSVTLSRSHGCHAEAGRAPEASLNAELRFSLLFVHQIYLKSMPPGMRGSGHLSVRCTKPAAPATNRLRTEPGGNTGLFVVVSVRLRAFSPRHNRRRRPLRGLSAWLPQALVPG